MAYTFNEFLKERDPHIYQEVLADLGVDLNDPKAQKAFVKQLQKQKGLDLKQIAADAAANPGGEPDPATLKANQAAQHQAAMQQGEAVPTGIKSSDWETSVGLLTPTGKAVPNEIGRGKPAVDVAGTLEKGAAQGALPKNINKLTPPWLKMKQVKPPVAAVTPTVDPNDPDSKMTPSDKAKVKSQPGAKA
jgi:ribosomal protein L12E/L44/L45/RPP1/RPP2